MAQRMFNITFQKLIQYQLFVDLEVTQIWFVSYMYCSEERRSVERTPFVWSKSLKDSGTIVVAGEPREFPEVKPRRWEWIPGLGCCSAGPSNGI